MLGLANLAPVRVETMDRFVESETIRTPFPLRNNCLLVFELHRTIRSPVHLSRLFLKTGSCVSCLQLLLLREKWRVMEPIDTEGRWSSAF